MDESIRLSNGRLRFESCLHIPGSVQVVYERDDGVRVVYTGDFKKPSIKTPVIDSDILIIDAVYGRPDYVRPFDNDVEHILNSFIEKLLKMGPVHVYAYYGKIHEVMLMLRENDIVAPFILPPTHYTMTRYAEGSGLRINDYLPLTSSEAEEIIRDKYYIYFNHYSNHFNEQYLNSSNPYRIVLSGWEFNKPIRRLSNRKWLIAFSDHSDFNGLLEYVKYSNPSKLIVNRRRSNGAYEFAKYVEEELNIKAEVR
jgi:putative mRNA 3-end processing factor